MGSRYPVSKEPPGMVPVIAHIGVPKAPGRLVYSMFFLIWFAFLLDVVCFFLDVVCFCWDVVCIFLDVVCIF